MDGELMQPNRNETHIITYPAGHILSCDCWCEPSKIYWTRMPNNFPILIVEHCDDSPAHHKVILQERTKKKDWITKTLDSVPLHVKGPFDD